MDDINPAGRFEKVIALLDNGILCQCPMKIVELDTGTYDMKIFHEKNCEGIAKAKELLFNDSDN